MALPKLLIVSALLLCSHARSAELVIKRGDVTKATVSYDTSVHVEFNPLNGRITLACAASQTNPTECRETIQVTQPAAPPPPFVTCPTNWIPYAWGNFQRTSERRFTDLVLQATLWPSSDFPQTQGLAHVGVSRNEYISLEFTVTPKVDNNGDGQLTISDFDALEKRFSWLGAQGSMAPSSVGGTYLSVSKCQGDFRVPTIEQVNDTSNPVTFNRGCRNIFTFQGSPEQLVGSMVYQIGGVSGNSTCALSYGETYYLNMIVVNPLDGYQTNEHNCSSSNVRCGIQLETR